MSGWLAVPRYRSPQIIAISLSCGHRVTVTQIPPWGAYRCPHCRQPRGIRELGQIPLRQLLSPPGGRTW